MQIIVPLLIILGISAFFFAGNITDTLKEIPLTPFRLEPTQVQEAPPPPSTIFQPSTQIPGEQKPSAPASFTLDTAITSGPLSGTIFSNTETVVFEFASSVIPSTTQGQLTYETYIQGIDADWIPTSTTKRRFTLPAGSETYTLYVRSKLHGTVDPTPATRTVSINVSPLFGKVRITGMKPTNNSTGKHFELTLRPTLAEQETITLSGMRVESKWQGFFTIPLGIEKYHPALHASNKDPITMTATDVVEIRGEGGALGQTKNFKTNICMGYLKKFFPTIPGSYSCARDKPTLQEVSHLVPLCQDFILNKIDFSACGEPDLNTGIMLQDSTCKAFAQSVTTGFNYEACYLKNSSSPTFTGNTWYVYENRTFGHPMHDIITLRDANGLLVDQYTY